LCHRTVASLALAGLPHRLYPERSSAGGVGADITYLRNYLSPLAVDRGVSAHGHGAFAIEVIPKGTVVAAFGGEIHRRYSFELCCEQRRSRSIQIDDDRYILGPPTRDPGDSINHSCEPNCGAGNAVQIVTMRDIKVGEELTFDYAMTDGSDYDEFTCACASPSCRGRVSGNDWRLLSIHRRFQGYISPYLVRRERASRRAQTLKKSDVEHMMSLYDQDSREALSYSLRIVLGRPFAHWNSLVGALPIPGSQRELLYRCDQQACDLLLTELNELRGVQIVDSLTFINDTDRS